MASSPLRKINPRCFSTFTSGKPKNLTYQKTDRNLVLLQPNQVEYKSISKSPIYNQIRKKLSVITAPSKFEKSEIIDLMYNGLKEEKSHYVLGKGGFGSVVLLCTKGNDVAVKLLLYPKQKVTLEKEKNAIGLNHLNLIKTLDVFIRYDSPFGAVVMESWYSLNLHTLIHSSFRIVTEEARIRYLLGISAGLEYCHLMGIVHLDVKPLNMLVDPNTLHSKLCDFGASYKITEDKSIKPSPKKHQGTIAYAAPELLRGEYPTFKCDTYSFGISMWHCLYCDLPYNGIPKNTIIDMVINLDERPKENHLVMETGYSKLYRQCWSAFPENRPSMMAIKNELEILLSNISNKIQRPIFQLLSF